MQSLNRNKSIRKNALKTAVIAAIITLALSAISLLEIFPSLNQIFFAVLLISTVISIASAVFLYIHPEREWDHDGI